MNICIVGCGPAGLLAALAAEDSGHTVKIVSMDPKPSQISGAQFLHQHIPTITPSTPTGTLTFQKEGDAAGYAAKVYGDPEAPTSWDHYEGEIEAWSMQEAYSALWDLYSSGIEDRIIDNHNLRNLLEDNDLVISTIPRNLLCCAPHQHKFHAARIFVVDRAWRELPDDTVLYSGDPTVHWYRTSKIFEHEGTESPVPTEGARQGTKPISTDCDCWYHYEREDNGLLLAGRFGCWQKGVLVHHAYREVMDALQ